jgi:hypothetical protein
VVRRHTPEQAGHPNRSIPKQNENKPGRHNYLLEGDCKQQFSRTWCAGMQQQHEINMRARAILICGAFKNTQRGRPIVLPVEALSTIHLPLSPLWMETTRQRGFPLPALLLIGVYFVLWSLRRWTPDNSVCAQCPPFSRTLSHSEGQFCHSANVCSGAVLFPTHKNCHFHTVKRVNYRQCN